MIWDEFLSNKSYTLSPNLSWPVERCKDGWEYNKTTVYSSIVMDVRIYISSQIV